METVDILIAVVAVIAVVGSVAGAALYEAPEGGVTWGVTFSESSEETLTSETASGSAAAATGTGEAALVTEHNITALGITALEFDVVLDTDRQLPRTGSVTYTAYLVAPDGEPLDGDAASAGDFGLGTSFTLAVPASYLLGLPEAQTVQADTAPAAREQVNETLLQSNATGIWEVHVHIDFAQGTAPIAENVESETTPKLRRAVAEVGTDLDIFAGA